MMTKLTISLPDSARGFIVEKVKRDGYGTVSEYIRELVRRDQKADAAELATVQRQQRANEFLWNKDGTDIYDQYEY